MRTRGRPVHLEGLDLYEPGKPIGGERLVPMRERTHDLAAMARAADYPNGLDLLRRLLRRGVIVRPVDGYGFPTCLRISLGTPAEGARLLEALDAVRGET